jgi:hypothetical protein
MKITHTQNSQEMLATPSMVEIQIHGLSLRPYIWAGRKEFTTLTYEHPWNDKNIKFHEEKSLILFSQCLRYCEQNKGNYGDHIRRRDELWENHVFVICLKLGLH